MALACLAAPRARARIDALLGDSGAALLALQLRAAALLQEARGASAGDAGVLPLPTDGEWLEDEAYDWLMRGLAKTTRSVALLREAARFRRALESGAVPFPTPAGRRRCAAPAIPLGDLEQRRAEATGREHRPGEVELWGRVDGAAFPLRPPGFAGDIGRAVAEGVPDDVLAAEEHLRQERLGEAAEPLGLRAWLCAEPSALDTEVPEGGAWQSADEGVVAAGAATEAQEALWRQRAARGEEHWAPEAALRRARRRGALPAFIQAACAWAPEVFPDGVPWPRRLELDRAREAARRARMEDVGAKYARWPEQRRWPAPDWGDMPARLAHGAAKRSEEARAVCREQAERGERGRRVVLKARYAAREESNRVALVEAVERVDAESVAKLRWYGIVDRELVVRACNLQQTTSGTPFAGLGTMTLEEAPSPTVVVRFLTGASCALCVEPSTTLREVRARVAQAVGAPPGAELCLRLASASGDALSDLGLALEAACDGAPPWALTAVAVQRASWRSAEVVRRLVPAAHLAEALRAAAMSGNDATVEALLERGADPNPALRPVCAAWAGSEPQRQVLRALLEAGASPAAELKRALDKVAPPFADAADDDEASKATAERLMVGWTLSGVLLGPWTRQSFVVSALLEHGAVLWPLVAGAWPGLRRDAALLVSLVAKFGAEEHLPWAAEDLRASRDFLLEAVEADASALGYAADALREDEDLVLAALRRSDAAAELVPASMWMPAFTLRVALANHKRLACAPVAVAASAATRRLLLHLVRELAASAVASYAAERAPSHEVSGVADELLLQPLATPDSASGLWRKAAEVAQALTEPQPFSAERARIKACAMARAEALPEKLQAAAAAAHRDASALERCLQRCAGAAPAERRLAAARAHLRHVSPEDLRHAARAHLRNARAHLRRARARLRWRSAVWRPARLTAAPSAMLRAPRWLVEGRVSRALACAGEEAAYMAEARAVHRQLGRREAAAAFLRQAAEVEPSSLPPELLRMAASELERENLHTIVPGHSNTFLLAWACGVADAARVERLDVLAVRRAMEARRDASRELGLRLEAARAMAAAPEEEPPFCAETSVEESGHAGVVDGLASNLADIEAELELQRGALEARARRAESLRVPAEAAAAEAAAVLAEVESELEPAMLQRERAIASIDEINLRDIGEFRGFRNPPAGTVDTLGLLGHMVRGTFEGLTFQHGELQTGFQHIKRWLAAPRILMDAMRREVPHENVQRVKALLEKRGDASAESLGWRLGFTQTIGRWIDASIAADEVSHPLGPRIQACRALWERSAEANEEFRKAEAVVCNQSRQIQDLEVLRQVMLDAAASLRGGACGSPATWLRRGR